MILNYQHKEKQVCGQKIGYDYYAFGSLMTGRNFSSPTYRYGFNGKEKDDELKGSGATYDYGMRMYDSRLGRFFSVDKLTSQYPELSPYHFASLNPIYFTDLDGNEGSPHPYSGGFKLNNRYAAQNHFTQNPISNKTVATVSIGTVTVLGSVLVGGALLNGLKWLGIYAAEEVVEELAGFPILPDPGDAVQAALKKQIKSSTSTFNIPTDFIKKGGSIRKAEGYSSNQTLDQHLKKRKKQGYDFKNVDDMVKYGKDFFKRTGDNISEFTDRYGNVHRMDKNTQEYGIIQPDNKIQSVFKVEPKPNSSYTDAESYMLEQIKIHADVEQQ